MAGLIMNAWYLAAWSHEVEQGPMRRTICGIPMVFWRKEDGTVVAQRDRCPHRFAPLSLGHVEGDKIVCPYHGLKFDAEGSCVFSPFGDPPERAKVTAFPIDERNAGIWIWPGDPDKADFSEVPDYSDYLADERLDCLYQRYVLEGHIMIGVENLLDLTHAAALHSKSFTMGEYNNFLNSEHKAHWEGDELYACWDIPFDEGRKVNETRTTWIAPGRMTISGSVDDKGRKLDPPWLQLHIYTPETETRTHYFTAERFNPEIESRNHVEERAALLEKLVFDKEDNPVVKAIQEEMGDQDFFDMEPALLPTDKACVMARRHYDKLLRAEQEEREAVS